MKKIKYLTILLLLFGVFLPAMLPFRKYRFFHLLLTSFLFVFHRIHDLTNYLHNIDMYPFCIGAIHRGYL